MNGSKENGMDAAAKLEMIEGAWAQGKTVYICTALRATKMTARNAEKWKAAGRPMVRVSGGSLQSVEGRRYVCADYCAISIEG